MIIDYGGTIDLAVGTDRRTMEQGDAQVVIPNVVLPIVLNLRPTFIAVNTTTKIEGSILLTFQQTQLASVAGSTLNVQTLAKGLWELEMSLSSLYSYAVTVAANRSLQAILSYQGQTSTLMTRFPTIGSFVDLARFRLLLTSDATIQMIQPTTGVSETFIYHLNANCIRIL